MDLNIRVGTTWQSDWPQGRIEPNRQIYDYEFVYFSSGNGRVITPDRTYLCREGTAIIIPPETIHCTIADTQVTRWCIHFDWNGDCPAYKDRRRIWVYQDESIPFQSQLAARPYPGSDLSFPACFQMSSQQQSRLLEALREFFRAPVDTLGGSLYRHGLFLQILGIVLGELHLPTPQHHGSSAFLRLKSLLDQRFTDSTMTLGDVARRLHLSPNHLNKIFRRHLGMSTQAYLLMRRITMAEELLQTTTLNIQEIAFACGFATPNYFTRYFRRKHGATPVEFRRRSQSASACNPATTEHSTPHLRQ